jgi:microsomal dipeptidase-like Zn-dependent dipeptidase
MRARLRPVLFLSALGLGACGQDPDEIYQYVVTEIAGPVEVKNPTRPPQQYRDAHAAAPVIIDMHADTLISPDEGEDYERLLSNPDGDGQVDVPRLLQGNVALQVFGVPSKASMDLVASEVLIENDCNYGVTKCDRKYYQRDPDGVYDDPSAPYQARYAPLGLPRDLGAYQARIAGIPCEAWYGTVPWDPTIWPETGTCEDYEKEREYMLRLKFAADRLAGALAEEQAGAKRLVSVRSRDDLTKLLAARKSGKQVVGSMLGTEGLYFPANGGSASGLAQVTSDFRELFNAGYRMFAMTHFIDSDHAGSNTGMGMAVVGGESPGRGLTAAGRRFVELAFQYGAVVDVAHASPQTVTDIASLATTARKPIVASHGGLRATKRGDVACDNPRNLSDDAVKSIAKTGGVVGIGFAESFNCGLKPSDFAKAVRAAVDLIDGAQLRRFGRADQPLLKGVDHVGLGTDYDGLIKAYTHVGNLEQYTEALMCKYDFVFRPNCLKRPFSAAEAHKILGQNTLRVFNETLPAVTQAI